MSERVVRLGLKPPHAGQAEILASRARFKVAFCGRRFGKTDMGVRQILVGTPQLPGATRVSDAMFWWVGLSWRAASMKRAWRLLKRACRGWCEIREADKEIVLPNGTQIWMRTAENADSLSGEGIRGVVFDEFTMASEDVWTEHLRPTLADQQGWALFIGVPKGKNWGWRLWTKKGSGVAGWDAFQMPTSRNPFIPADEIASAKDDIPQRLYEQEFLAAIVDDEGAVFRGVLGSVKHDFYEPTPRSQYVYGIDWGRQNDFTVITVIDSTTGEVAAFDRFNQIDYAIQKGRLLALTSRFTPTMVLPEQNSMGVPLIEDLVRMGLPVQPFVTTNASKALIIDALALAFERGEVRIPEAWAGATPEARPVSSRVLLDELQAYEQTQLPGGMRRFGAPDGMHDDCVMSLALAWHAHQGAGAEGMGWLGLARDARAKREAAA